MVKCFRLSIYKPTITALKIYPLMPKGSVIAFDELGMEK